RSGRHTYDRRWREGNGPEQRGSAHLDPGKVGKMEQIKRIARESGVERVLLALPSLFPAIVQDHLIGLGFARRRHLLLHLCHSSKLPPGIPSDRRHGTMRMKRP